MQGLSLVAASGGQSSSQCAGLSLSWPLVVGHRLQTRRLSSCGSQALERRLSSCDSRAQLLCRMWDLPRPGLEPASPALASRLSTTAPPGKPYRTSLRWFVSSQGGLHLTHPSRQCFLSCGCKSSADYENNLMGCNYHLKKKKYNSVESKIDGCVVCNKLSIVL